MTDIYKVFDFI